MQHELLINVQATCIIKIYFAIYVHVHVPSKNCPYVHVITCISARTCIQHTYQSLIHSEGMLEHLVKGLKTKDEELQKHCASAIFKVSTYNN